MARCCVGNFLFHRKVSPNGAKAVYIGSVLNDAMTARLLIADLTSLARDHGSLSLYVFWPREVRFANGFLRRRLGGRFCARPV
jgi:hypothetical protein